jgi:hypothetical protein
VRGRAGFRQGLGRGSNRRSNLPVAGANARPPLGAVPGARSSALSGGN